ncbi:hypothetical protein Hanom_Chr10g00904441 [Helianthus anomalus]
MSIYFPGRPRPSKLSQISCRGTVSYAFSRSINTICKSCFFALYFSINLLRICIASLVDLPFMNPNWFTET